MLINREDMSDYSKIMEMIGDAKDKDILLDVRNDNPSFTEKEDFYDNLITLIEENPTVFYDTSELEDLGVDGINDGVTQKTTQEWEEWIEEQMKKCEE